MRKIEQGLVAAIISGVTSKIASTEYDPETRIVMLHGNAICI